MLASKSPDGSAAWQDYTLATAHLPDTANPGGDPSDTALFALDDKTGNARSGSLYVAVPGCPGGTCTQPGTSTGTPGGGSPEIWTISGTTATAYTIAGITGTTPSAAKESSSTVTYPSSSWALNDGAANPATPHQGH